LTGQVRDLLSIADTLISVPQGEELEPMVDAFASAGYLPTSVTLGKLECRLFEALHLLFAGGTRKDAARRADSASDRADRGPSSCDLGRRRHPSPDEELPTMTPRPQSSGPSDAAPDVPNLGLVRPPLVYLVSLVAGGLAQLAKPFPFLPGRVAVPLGASLTVVAIALFAYSVATFRAAGTPVPARKPTTVIVRTGPYRFSRNPIYLAFSLLQLGIAIWANSVWLVATLVGAVALMAVVVVPKEEQYLERRFGAQYVDYKASVRRWL
jgi:protein-S-isoprenylcysteine O-methyltransferase Ste14